MHVVLADSGHLTRVWLWCDDWYDAEAEYDDEDSYAACRDT